MYKRCDWRRRLLDVLGVRINVPQLTNKYLPCQQHQQQQSSLSSSLTSPSALHRTKEYTHRRSTDHATQRDHTSALVRRGNISHIKHPPNRFATTTTATTTTTHRQLAHRLEPVTNSRLPRHRNDSTGAGSPCPSVGGLIAHHKWVGEFFLADPYGAHMCEYSFFVDKIKDEVK